MLVEFIAGGKKISQPFEGVELTTADAAVCGKMIERLAIETFLARPRVVETAIREWLIENRKGTPTTRQEFDEAVRRVVCARWGL